VGLRGIGKSLGKGLYRGIGHTSGQLQEMRSLPVDVLEGEESYLLVFDAPGIEREDVQVRYVDGTVKVRTDRFRELYDGYEMRFPGRGMALDGEAELPEDASVVPGGASAWIADDGTLHVEVPKADADVGTDGEDAEVELGD